MPTVVRNGITIQYDAHGAGPAVVFIHSFLCDRTLFIHQVVAFHDRFRVINMDLRGHGNSSHSESPFELYDLVDDVLAVLDAERIFGAVWVGLSVGGFVALRAALRMPDRVRALVLMDTEAGPQSVPKRLQDVILKAALRLVGPRPIASGIAAAMLGKTTAELQASLYEEYRLRFTRARVKSICSYVDAVMHRDDVLKQLGRIRCPTLVMVGEEDRALPVEKSRLIHIGIPDSELVVIPRAGHLSAVEQPEAVNSALDRFLAGL